MTIDVLSHNGDVPIIVGAAEEMAELRGIGRDSDGRFHLLLKSQLVQLASSASSNFATAKELILVEINQNAITAARKVRLDNIADGQALSIYQRGALEKAFFMNSAEERTFNNAALDDFWRTCCH